MSDYVLITFMVLTLLMPWAAIAVSLGLRLPFARSDIARIILATASFFIAAYIHFRTAQYSYKLHSEWWMSEIPLGVLYAPAVICLMILTAIGEEVIDQRRRKQRH